MMELFKNYIDHGLKFIRKNATQAMNVVSQTHLWLV